MKISVLILILISNFSYAFNCEKELINKYLKNSPTYQLLSFKKIIIEKSTFCFQWELLVEKNIENNHQFLNELVLNYNKEELATNNNVMFFLDQTAIIILSLEKLDEKVKLSVVISDGSNLLKFARDILIKEKAKIQFLEYKKELDGVDLEIKKNKEFYVALINQKNTDNINNESAIADNLKVCEMLWRKKRDIILNKPEVSVQFEK